MFQSFVASGLLIHQVSSYTRLHIPFNAISGTGHDDPWQKLLIQTKSNRERPDTIRCIVASLVGDGESGDSLVDDNEPIQPLQQQQEEDYSDPNWEPAPIDAGPGMSDIVVFKGSPSCF